MFAQACERASIINSWSSDRATKEVLETSLPSAVNMSARRVVAMPRSSAMRMAADKGNTCIHGQQFGRALVMIIQGEPSPCAGRLTVIQSVPCRFVRKIINPQRRWDRKEPFVRMGLTEVEDESPW